jgi:hypothetical protein
LSAFHEQVRRTCVSVDGISLPSVLAPGTSDVIVFRATLPQGAGAAAYVFVTACVAGAEADGRPPSGGVLSSAAGVVSGPDDSTQPAVASTATGTRRAVRASGRGRERTAHFSWGTVRRGPHCGRKRQCHTSTCGAEGRTRCVPGR